MTEETLRSLVLAEIGKGIAKARAAHPESIPAWAEAMAAATLQIVPETEEILDSNHGSALPKR